MVTPLTWPRAGRSCPRSIELQAGINAVQVSHQVAGSGAYSYEAVFIPDDPQADRVTANNKGHGHGLGQRSGTHCSGR